MTRRSWQRAIVWVGALVGVLSVAAPASAHTGQELDAVWSGLLHPVLGLDHLLAIVTVGTLAYVLGRDVALPGAFVGAMALGGALGIAGVTVPFGEAAVAVSVLALGGALVAGAAMRRGPALALVALAGLAHGHAHGLEAPAAAHPAVYVAGFVAATVALHGAGWLVGSAVHRRPAVRTAMGAAVLGAGAGLAVGLI